jgi:SPP1 family predicted phage head-tail adaptor
VITLDDVLLFPIVTVTEDALGQKIPTEDYSREVFCHKKSIPQNEFFQAGQSGIKASFILIVHQLDYKEEVKLRYNDKIFYIYRTYERSDEKIELYCEVKASGS